MGSKNKRISLIFFSLIFVFGLFSGIYIVTHIGDRPVQEGIIPVSGKEISKENTLSIQPTVISQEKGQPSTDKTSPIEEEITAVTSQESDPYLQKRLNMVENTISNRGVENPLVLEAMRCVPRHEFVSNEYLNFAYADTALPIGYGQTISQPYIVAVMSELLELEKGDKVLEIGTGSGYQAAVLAEMGLAEIFTVEIIPELADEARQTLQNLEYDNLHFMEADGYYGWPEFAPYDAIIVTAAPDHLPQPLVEQLAEDGRLVIPIGPQGSVQTLWKFIYEDGELVAYNQGWVRFVPFTRE